MLELGNLATVNPYFRQQKATKAQFRPFNFSSSDLGYIIFTEARGPNRPKYGIKSDSEQRVEIAEMKIFVECRRYD